MRGAWQRMTSVCNGLQDLLRLTSGEVHREQIDVTALTKDIVREIKAGGGEPDVKFEVAHRITASGDRRLVRILLSNLLDNAWKFTSVNPSPQAHVGTETIHGQSRTLVRPTRLRFHIL